jgi:N6-adenosine-specific RNA methylase IME4
MAPAAIAQLPVAELAADDCALLLWVTGPHLAISTHLAVIEAWGFRPSTIGFTWVKTNLDGSPATGLGYYTRSNAEVCLIGIKGKPQRLARDVHQVVMAPVGEHSAKPEEVRRRIERLFAGPYLELYARRSVPGWTTWATRLRAPNSRRPSMRRLNDPCPSPNKRPRRGFRRARGQDDVCAS